MNRFTTTVALAGVLLFGFGCESTQDTTTQPASMGMINETCPLEGGPVNPDCTVEYEGYTVGFCCSVCKGKWATLMGDADRAAWIKSQL